MSLPNYMGCLMQFYKSCIIILYENVFQNPEFFPKQSTFVTTYYLSYIKIISRIQIFLRTKLFNKNINNSS
jgi:hypothetical protein